MRDGGYITYNNQTTVTNNNNDVGDHPCCPSGLPLLLGWTMVREFHAKFKAYETKRKPRRERSKEELGLNGEASRGILRNLVVGGVASANASDIAMAHEEPPPTSEMAGGDGRGGSRMPGGWGQREEGILPRLLPGGAPKGRAEADARALMQQLHAPQDEPWLLPAADPQGAQARGDHPGGGRRWRPTGQQRPDGSGQGRQYPSHSDGGAGARKSFDCGGGPYDGCFPYRAAVCVG
jgi:hypothetical protein